MRPHGEPLLQRTASSRGFSDRRKEHGHDINRKTSFSLGSKDTFNVAPAHSVRGVGDRTGAFFSKGRWLI